VTSGGSDPRWDDPLNRDDESLDVEVHWIEIAYASHIGKNATAVLYTSDCLTLTIPGASRGSALRASGLDPAAAPGIRAFIAGSLMNLAGAPSHAHPDHFIGLDVITDRFPQARTLSTPNVVADLQQDGPGIFALLKGKLGAEGPQRLVIPEAVTEFRLRVGSVDLEIVEFGEGESKRMAAVYIPSLKALLSADLVFNSAHLYFAERHLDAWLA
jgi:hypothetical protein